MSTERVVVPCPPETCVVGQIATVLVLVELPVVVVGGAVVPHRSAVPESGERHDSLAEVSTQQASSPEPQVSVVSPNCRTKQPWNKSVLSFGSPAVSARSKVFWRVKSKSQVSTSMSICAKSRGLRTSRSAPNRTKWHVSQCPNSPSSWEPTARGGNFRPGKGTTPSPLNLTPVSTLAEASNPAGR